MAEKSTKKPVAKTASAKKTVSKPAPAKKPVAKKAPAKKPAAPKKVAVAPVVEKYPCGCDQAVHAVAIAYARKRNAHLVVS